MTSMANTSAPAPLNRADVVGVCGDILDWKIKAIIESGATPSELEAASAWAAGADEVLGEERAPLTGATAAVYEILTTEKEFDEEA